MSQIRQLAAIMFTDIAGYTALMGEDEQTAFDLLDKNRLIQKPQIEKFGGKWIKEMGDGVLASFVTATAAVRCAVSIQEASRKEPGLYLRIGIHLGEVVFENEDVFGDSVNIASRLQAIAAVGAIYITEAVYNNIANKKGMVIDFVGEECLKNVKDPIRVYQVYPKEFINNPVNSTPTAKKISINAPPKSIAVLPFVNMSNDPEQEYFSDGMAEEILNSLVHLKNLKVAGRTSCFQFKGKNIDLREIGEKLGVNTVLEGSIRKQGNRLRITTQLINVADGFHLWSEKYDRNLDDIFAIQDEIALAITEKLKVTLLDKDRELVTKTATQNPEAYELYLKGWFYLKRRGNFILKGLAYFKQAIALDPNYALAYTGYANANFAAAFYGFISGREAMVKGKEAADVALHLDNSLGETYCALGFYNVHFAWDWPEAKKNFCKAIELNPKYTQAYSFYGMMYLAWVAGDFSEAEKQGKIALRLEPLSAIDHADFAWTLFTARKFEEALAVAQAGVDLDSNSFLSQQLKGLCLLALHHFDKAINTFKHLVKISNRHQHAVNCLIWAYCGNGNIAAAAALMEELEQRTATEYIAGTNTGLSAAWLGAIDKAFYYLEKAYQEHDPILMTLKHAPNIPALLRQDARFQNLTERIGFS